MSNFRVRRAAGLVIVLLASLAPGGVVAVSDAALSSGENALATTPTHAIWVQTGSPGCADGTTDGGSQIMLSDDRGATWTPGPCDPRLSRNRLLLDPVTGLPLYRTATSIVWLGAAGNVAGEVALADPTTATLIAANRGFAYVDGASGHLTRVGRDGSTFTCAFPGYGMGGTDALLGFADGTLVGWGSSSQNPWLISHDGRAGHTSVVNAVDCGPTFQAIGPEAIYCGNQLVGQYFDVTSGRLAIGLSIKSTPRFGIDGSTFEVLDDLSTPTVPATWPTGLPATSSVKPGDPFPSSAAVAAVGTLNQHWRVPLGLPPLTWSALAAQVATNHALEWQLAGVLPAPAQDSETPGAPGFTGATSLDRCAAVDLYLCSEHALPGTPDSVSAIAEVTADPSFDWFMLQAQQIGIGSSPAGSVATMPYAGLSAPNYAVPGTVSDLAIPVNRPISMLHIWPPDGADDVPAVWHAPQFATSDPLTNYGGPFPVGFPIFSVGSEPATYQLLDRHGLPVHLIEAGFFFPVTSLTTAGGLTAFPTLALTPGATYTIVVQPAFGGRQELHFTVAGGAAAAPSQARACTVAVRQTRAGRGTRVALALNARTCSGVRVQWRRRAPLAWRTVAAHGIVAPVGRVLYWRARRGTRVVLHGKVVVRRPPR